jgi:hypothetical protein
MITLSRYQAGEVIVRENDFGESLRAIWARVQRRFLCWAIGIPPFRYRVSLER